MQGLISVLIMALVLAALPATVARHAIAQSTEQSAPAVKIDKRKLLVQPRNADGSVQEVSVFEDPVLWARDKQQNFYRQMSGALRQMTSGSALAATWTLMLLSFGYGVFHAAGPGHGKAVISAWLLATENELRRGVAISAMSAIVQALTAITLVSVLFLVVASVGPAARNVAGVLESASYGMIALLGLYLVWTAVKAFFLLPSSLRKRGSSFKSYSDERFIPEFSYVRDRGMTAAGRTRVGTARLGPRFGGDDVREGDSDLISLPAGTGERGMPLQLHRFDNFVPSQSSTTHIHGPDCGCGHAHVPDARNLRGDWSFARAFSLAFAVGIRPCTGAILVLVFANGLGLYWAGVASTFAMALGTFITVSIIAAFAVYSKRLATRLAGGSGRWLNALGLGLRLGGGLAIAFLGIILFLGSLGSTNAMM